MSFNTNDNNLSPISRTNYEEYFLLYVDNELNTTERLEVEAFLTLHPDLQAEIDILLSTKLPADLIQLQDKESLMSDSISLNSFDESLLLYIDNELDKAAKEKLEAQLKKDKTFQLQHQALLQTKLDAAEVIPYPNKKELYRRTERRISPYWLRIAAAVIIVLGIGALVAVNQQNTAAPSVVKNPAANKPANTERQMPLINEPVATPALAEQSEAVAEQKEITAPQQSPEKMRGLAKRKAVKETEDSSPIATAPVDNNLPKPIVEEPSNAIVATEPVRPPKQIINNEPVTSAKTASLNPTDISPKTAEQRDLLAGVDNEKKSSLKGFLRKATRFIERRTNIKATNENDELLIGAVALKL